MADQPTDQDDVFGALFLVLQLPDIKVGIVGRLEHISTLLLLLQVRLLTPTGIKLRGRHLGFLQQCWA
jgi:hypothetical protein